MAYHSVEKRMRPNGDNLNRGALQPAHRTSCHGSLHDPVLHLRTRLDGLRRRSVQRGWLVHSPRMAQYSTEARHWLAALLSCDVSRGIRRVAVSVDGSYVVVLNNGRIWWYKVPELLGQLSDNAQRTGREVVVSL